MASQFDREKAVLLAKQYKTFYDELIKVGFDREEALEIVIAWIGRDAAEEEGRSF
jgi:hypothetical protein